MNSSTLTMVTNQAKHCGSSSTLLGENVSTLLKQPFIIVICGLPGTGKTTLAENLGFSLQATFLSTEDLFGIIKKKENSKPDCDMSANEQEIVYSFMGLLAYHVADSGGNIIIAGVYRDYSQRKLFEKKCGKKGKILWIELIASKDIVIKRLETRVLKNSNSPAGPKTFEDLSSKYQYHGMPFLRINTDSLAPHQVHDLALKHLKEYFVDLKKSEGMA